jgi:hypothetical protein
MTTTKRRAVLAFTAAAIVIAGIVIAFSGHSGRAHGGTVRQAAESQSEAPGPSAPMVPTVDLSGLTWVNFHGYSLPVAAQAGPHDTAGGVAAGYSDTPLGALLAAVNIGARTSWQLGPEIFQPAIQDQVTGPYQAQMLSSDLDTYSANAAQIPDIRAYASIVAYQWVGYTPADATVDLVAEGPGDNGTTVYVATQMETEWVNGDWRVVAPPGGDWGNSAVQIPSLNGYLTFPRLEG